MRARAWGRHLRRGRGALARYHLGASCLSAAVVFARKPPKKCQELSQLARERGRADLPVRKPKQQNHKMATPGAMPYKIYPLL